MFVQNKLILPLLGIILLVTLAIFQIDRSLRESTEQKLIGGELKYASENINTAINDAYSDISFLSRWAIVRQVVKSPDLPLRQTLEAQMAHFAKEKKRYSQIRFLDITGQEILRVNYKNGQAQKVAQEQLQDKSNRYYFKESEKLQAGEVFQSQLDLNVENGKIVTPFEPTIRFSTPITSLSNQILGYLVINFNAKILLDNLAELNKLSKAEFYLLNKNGDYLFHQLPSKRWGFMLNNPKANFQHDYPNVLAQFNHQTSPVVTAEDQNIWFTKICDAGLPCGQTQPNQEAVDTPWVLVATMANTPLGSDNWWQSSWPFFIISLLTLVALIATSLSHRLQRSYDAILSKDHQLQEANSRFQALMQALPAGLLVTNKQGEITEVNPSVEAIFERKAYELLGEKVEVLMPESFRQQHQKYRQSYFRSPNRRIVVGIDAPFEYLSPNGNAKKITVTLVPLELNEQTWILVKVNDVTEQLEKLERQKQGQKLESLGQLVGGVAHDFNNLLGLISGNLELLEMQIEASDPPQREKYLKQIHKILDTTGMATGITKKLLTISRKRQLEPQWIPLASHLEEIQELLRRTLGKNIQLTTFVAEDTPQLCVDPFELNNALINLSINARDAMPNGGAIQIHCQTIQIKTQPQKLLTGELPLGDYVLLEFRDTGSGIPKAIQQKILEPFFTTKAVGEGTGLGLSMVYAFVKQSNGYLNILSQENQGTHIQFYFPITPASAPQTDRSDNTQSELEAAIKQPFLRGKKVLIVDDEHHLAEVAQRFLNSVDAECDIVNNVDSAVDSIKNNHYDIVFSDVNMPGKRSGVDLCEIVMAEHPSIIMLLTSGYSSEFFEDRRPCLQNVKILPKPYKKQQMLQHLYQATKRAQQQDAKQPKKDKS